MSDRIFGAVGVVLSIFYIWQATLIQESPFSDIVGPKIFPIIVGAVLGLSALYFLFRPDSDPHWPAAARLFEIAMAVAAMVAYALILPKAGFVIATALASAYLTWRLGTRPLQSVLVGILVSGGIYAVFHLILGLSLARGPFGF